ncbi:thioredoxin family protein [Planococcus lenghuensis]|uniref:Thioredoxin n=1 Tax=Planococcus lenghuensis TaxID=2213202 RepID=A0A1Q2KWD5_9BACL|nr:thioredoxin family protein [Planococcus lenghuensis]AQQ52528.1 thioredoxin [Planococcus lenghuensis]
MKKLLIIGAVVVAIFVLLIFLNNAANEEKLAGNPYGTDDLKQETIDQLDDENYQNIILPDELDEKIASGEPTTVYYFSPTCPHCQETTPILMPVAEEMDVEVDQYNLWEFEQGWDEYAIQGTPTLVHYENGEEVARWEGSQPEGNIRRFFDEIVLN